MTTTTASRASLPTRGTLSPAARAWLGIVAVVGAWLVLLATFPSLPGVPCLFRAATGHACLGCGLTRACRALLRGDVRAALAYHPLVLFVAVAAACHTVRVVTAWRLGTPWPRSIPRPVIVVFGAAFAVGIVRLAADRAMPVIAALAP